MFTRIMSLPLWLHGGLAAGAFAAFQGVKSKLDQSYAASGHPVDYATGQLTFDASKIESYYAVMQGKGALDVYRTTQFIDFGFIAAVMILGLLLGTLVARLGPEASWGRRLGKTAAILAVTGAIFDALENLASFAMLREPTAISQPLALIYSSFAAIKFAALTAAMVALLASLALGLWARMAAR